MGAWSERVAAAGLPFHPTEATGPLLACLDAYVLALRARGWDAWVLGQRGPDPILQLHAAKDGREGPWMGFLVGRDVLHEVEPHKATYRTVEALSARLRDHATHTGAFAWIAAGHVERCFGGSWKTPQGRVDYLDGPSERMEAVELGPGRATVPEDLCRELQQVLEGFERFEPIVDMLVSVLDEFAAGFTWQNGLSLQYLGGNPRISGRLASQVALDRPIFWAALRFRVERTGLRPCWPANERLLQEPDALRAYLEEAVCGAEGRTLAAQLRLAERQPLELDIAGHPVRLGPDQRAALWRALGSGRRAEAVAQTGDVSALLAALPHQPEVRLRMWGVWTLQPERCRALEAEGQVALVGDGRPAPRRALLPGHVVAGRSSWSERIEALLMPLGEGARPVLAPPAAQRELDPEQSAVLAEAARQLQSTGRLAAWWRCDAGSKETLELCVRPAGSAELVAPVVHLDLHEGKLSESRRHGQPAGEPLDLDGLREAIVHQLEGAAARHVARQIETDRRRDWIPVDAGH